MCDFKQFIEKKINRLKEAYDIKNKISFPLNITNENDLSTFAKIFEQNNYINKKIQYIIKTRTVYNMKKLLDIKNGIITESIAIEFITKLFTYNEKLDIKTLPKNYIGYDLLLDNFNSGIQEEEFKKNIIPFICSHYENPDEIECIKKQVDINNFNIYATSYFEMIQFINKILEQVDIM
jgi:hypothetical protein